MNLISRANLFEFNHNSIVSFNIEDPFPDIRIESRIRHTPDHVLNLLRVKLVKCQGESELRQKFQRNIPHVVQTLHASKA